MIEETEFERRVEHWFGSVMKALEDNTEGALKATMKLHEIRRDDPNLFPDHSRRRYEIL